MVVRYSLVIIYSCYRLQAGNQPVRPACGMLIFGLPQASKVSVTGFPLACDGQLVTGLPQACGKPATSLWQTCGRPVIGLQQACHRPVASLPLACDRLMAGLINTCKYCGNYNTCIYTTSMYHTCTCAA